MSWREFNTLLNNLSPDSVTVAVLRYEKENPSETTPEMERQVMAMLG